jgi:hypothetical protein
MSKDSYYTYFAPGGPGVLRIDLSRTAYNAVGPPGIAVIRVGTVGINAQGEPSIARLTALRVVRVRDGRELTVRIPVAATPVTVAVQMSGLVHDPPDPRPLGAVMSYSFRRSRAER